MNRIDCAKAIWQTLICHNRKSIIFCLYLFSLFKTRTFADTLLSGEENRKILEQVLNTLPAAERFVKIGDMLFPVETVKKFVNGQKAAFKNNLWPSGDIYFEFDANVSNPDLRQSWLHAAELWECAANVHFHPRLNEPNYIHIQNGNTNDSEIGMSGGEQVMHIYNWNSRFIMAHEIGHALGLIHEHQRSDRDSYVNVHLENVDTNLDPNRLDFIMTADAAPVGPYDFESVMHYKKDAFTIVIGNPNYYTIVPWPGYDTFVDKMGQRDYLSNLDRAGMAQRYGSNTNAGYANDDFSNAGILYGDTGNTGLINLQCAFMEPGEPLFDTENGSRWWIWQPSRKGTATFKFSAQSSTGIYLSVYSGTSLLNLQRIDGTSTYAGERSFSFKVNSLTRYYIQLSAQTSLTEIAELNWSLCISPANDDLADAQPLPPTFSVASSNECATRETQEPWSTGYRTIWFTWQNPTNEYQDVTLATDGSSSTLAPIVSVYTRDTYNTLQLFDSANGFLRLNARPNTTYRIALGCQQSDTAGNYRLFSDYPPQNLIRFPAGDALVPANGANFQFEGVVTDDYGFRRIQYSTDSEPNYWRDIQPYDIEYNKKARWILKPQFPLSSGDHTYYFRAQDTAGQYSSLGSRLISVTNSINKPPTIQNLLPSNYSVIDTEEVTFSGIAFDPDGPNFVKFIYVEKDASNYYYTEGSGYSGLANWSLKVPVVNQGMNHFNIYAVDGNFTGSDPSYTRDIWRVPPAESALPIQLMRHDFASLGPSGYWKYYYFDVEPSTTAVVITLNTIPYFNQVFQQPYYPSAQMYISRVIMPTPANSVGFFSTAGSWLIAEYSRDSTTHPLVNGRYYIGIPNFTLIEQFTLEFREVRTAPVNTSYWIYYE